MARYLSDSDKAILKKIVDGHRDLSKQVAKAVESVEKADAVAGAIEKEVSR